MTHDEYMGALVRLNRQSLWVIALHAVSLLAAVVALVVLIRDGSAVQFVASMGGAIGLNLAGQRLNAHLWHRYLKLRQEYG